MATPPAELLNQVPEAARDTIVDFIEGPGGQGHILLGADGGVFAIGGAQFHGAYTTLAPEQRQGERSFERIEQTASGGYRLVSNKPGEEYRFGPPPGTVVQPPPDEPAPPSQPAPIEEGAGARASIRSTLSAFGLDFSASELDKLVDTHIKRGDAGFMLELRQTGQYAARFPAMAALRDQGQAINEATYIGLEKSYGGLFKQFGLDGIYDTTGGSEDLAALIGGQLSPKEVADRIEMAGDIVSTWPQEEVDTLRRVYGVTPGELTAMALDPDRGEERIQRRISTGRLQQVAELGGAAQRTGFDAGLSMDELERLAELGITPDQARTGFGELARSRQLFQTLPGQAGQDIGQEAQLGAAFEGDVGAQEQIERRRRRRTAQFEGGGSFAAGQGGVSGLGGT